MKRLAKNAGVLLEDPDDIYGERSFSRDAIMRFGDLSNELVDCEPKIHLQMGVLATLAAEALEAGDAELAKAIFEFLDEVLAHDPISSEIPNAVAISFLAPEQIRDSARGVDALSFIPQRVISLIEYTNQDVPRTDDTKA